MNANNPVEIVPEERAELARRYFHDGCNCCQAVTLAFRDVFGVDEAVLRNVATGFGGGMGRMREVCGAFSGCVIAAGFISPVPDCADHQAKTANYALVREFADRFREANGGSIVCRELLGLDRGPSESPAPSERTSEYYRKRPCEEIVGNAARIIAEKLNQ